MNLKTALGLLEKHEKAIAVDSFSTFLLDCQLSGKASAKKLEKISGELMEALETINKKQRSNGFAVTRLELVRAITIILVEGWERYSWWTVHNYLPNEFLVRLSRFLSDLGFA